jgi:hypothetical protein
MADARMIERRQYLRLTPEACQPIWIRDECVGQNLQRDVD